LAQIGEEVGNPFEVTGIVRDNSLLTGETDCDLSSSSRKSGSKSNNEIKDALSRQGLIYTDLFLYHSFPESQAQSDSKKY
jgi:hypothetical protein